MNRLSKKTFISVRKSVLICFILMAAAAILPAARCAYHLGGHDFDGGMARLMGAGPAPENPDGTGPNAGIRPDTRINAIRNQLLMGSLTSLICTLGAFLFLTKTVVAPIRQLFEITRIMAEGRLDAFVPPGPGMKSAGSAARSTNWPSTSRRSCSMPGTTPSASRHSCAGSVNRFRTSPLTVRPGASGRMSRISCGK